MLVIVKLKRITLLNLNASESVYCKHINWLSLVTDTVLDWACNHFVSDQNYMLLSKQYLSSSRQKDLCQRVSTL